MPKYDNDPIIEAVCEIRFRPTGNEDATVVGLTYGLLKDGFPTKRSATVLVSTPFPGQQNVFGEARTQFVSADEKEIIAVAPNVISISRLAPYPTWNEYLPLIRKALSAYLQVSTPEHIQHVGLRYINRIVFPESIVNLDDWLTYYIAGPQLATDSTAGMNAFLALSQVFLEGDRDVLQLQLSNGQPTPENRATCMLDINYSLGQVGAINVSQIEAWLTSAHTNIEAYFEACITPKLRERFKPQ